MNRVRCVDTAGAAFTQVGGRKHYAEQPQVVKDIVRGLKDSLILERCQDAGGFQRHLEALKW